MSYQCILITDLIGQLWARPIGAYRLATELRAAGFSTLVINGVSDFSQEELSSVLENNVGESTLFVGVSSTFIGTKSRKGSYSGKRGTQQVSNSFDSLLLGLKSTYKNLKIIVGGARAHNKSYASFDLEILGYADEIIVTLAKEIKENRNLMLPRSIVASNDFDFSKMTTLYKPEDCVFEGETLVLELSRGCRFKCKFCSYPLNGRKPNTYFKNQETLYAELIYNYENFNVTKYIFSDDTYNESITKLEYFKTVFDRLPFKIEFSCYLRLDLIHYHKNMISLLLDSGLRGAFFGIESLNTKSASAIGKGLGSEKITQTLHLLRQQWGKQVTTTGAFIVGLPYDSRESLNDSLSILAENDYPLNAKHYNPLRIGTPNARSPWQSEFQKNPQLFGYRVTSQIDADHLFWENDFLNVEEAQAISDEFNKKLRQNLNMNYDNFHHLLLMGYGLHHSEALTLFPKNEEHNMFIDSIVKKRVVDYKSRMLKA